ncbi:L,D-transpeptidase [Paracoccus sp. M683]|uniref:L,D-transpeptidase family protein n=1 Tax=Paracoccus sp. M683 TaxID=2594268 RepID=UPI00117CF73F|nr:L,D-transpeptidase [Paracoccus sp. M683]TRW99256.1 L,D-transpeptidase [Paracoccus sp. M683]
MTKAPKPRKRRSGRLFRLLVIALLLGGLWLALTPQTDLRLPGTRPDAPQVTLPQRPPTRPALPQARLTGPVDRILIEKSQRRMTVYRQGDVLKTYRIGLGFAPAGDKHQQGDGRTPEGVFRIDRRNDRSAYHLSLGIDYPRAQDRARAQAAGVNPGGDIFIHGQPNQRPEGEVLAGDWTAGCIAISDAEIAELFAATALGTTVEIRP